MTENYHVNNYKTALF